MANAVPRTVRAKLLTAIAAMLGLMLGSSILAIGGLERTGTALVSLGEERLPDIVAATQLARQSTALAALAPFVSSVEVMNQLEVETLRIDAMIADLRKLVAELPPSTAFSGPRGAQVRALADSLSQATTQLLGASREALELRAELVELHYGLERQPQPLMALQGPEWAGARQDFALAVEAVLAARIVDSPLRLDQLEARYRATAAALGRAALPTELLWLPRFLDQQGRLFDLRRREILGQQRIRFLLASIHAMSTDMGGAVSSIVGTTSEAAEVQSRALSATLERTRRGIALLGAIALAAAGLTALYVLTDLARNLDAVTRAMSRLAAGDRSASIPGLQRGDELGSLARAFSVFKDASREREELAERVIEGNRLVEAMFANMSDGISVFDRARRLVSWNPQFLTMTGLDPEEVRHGAGFDEVAEAIGRAGVRLHGLDGQPLAHSATADLRSGHPATYELQHPDGRVTEIRSQPMPEGGFVTVYMDQTDRRRIERQLHQAQRMEAVGQLTGGIAHDFNNFLAAISGNLQMLQDQLYDDPALSARILRALDATERAASVTERLLAFARQQALRPELTRVEELMLNLLELLGHRLGPGVEIRARFDADLPAVLVDPGQLENAVLNLLFNGRDAMPAGGAVTLEVFAPPGGGVAVAVSDSGIGMSPEVLARIYEPFFTTKANGRGSGLGLSMVYGFIAQSGGEIAVTSTPGQGTRVEIRLPPAATVDLPPSRTETVFDTPGRGQHILLVEDDPLVRETAADMLLSLGYRVWPVGDLAAARAALQERRFDLLFSDILLPEGQTGLDVAREAAALQPGLPVLFASGYMPAEGAEPLQLPPGAVLLRKPYRKTDLGRALAGVLGGVLRADPAGGAVS